MARAIDGDLQQIAEAVYGEEVRGSIIDAIEQCYTDANDVVKVSETQPITENTKIWIKPTSDEYKVPTYEEHQAVADDVNNLKNAVGDGLLVIQNGSYSSGKWTTNNYSVFFEVVPGSDYYIESNGVKSATYYGLKSVTFPLAVNDLAVRSEADGWTSARSVTPSCPPDEGTIPDDVHYLYFYAGLTTEYDRLPGKAVLNGIDMFGSVQNNIQELASTLAQKETEIKQNKNDILQNADAIAVNKRAFEALCYSYPYGLHPFQLSLFKKTTNLFSNFCNYISGAYYGLNGAVAVGRSLLIKYTAAWKSWLIRVKPNTTYTLGPCDFAIVFFNADFISEKVYQTAELSNTEPNTISSGNDSYWMALVQRIGRDMSEWMMVEGDAYPSEYVSGYPQWVDTPKSVTNKTIAFFGDSITAGSGWTGEPDSQGYHQYIHDLYGFTCLNYGYGGSGYVTIYEGTGGVRGIGQPGKGVSNSEGSFTPNNIAARLTEVTPSDLDGVVIFAGTNDWSHQVSLTDFATALDTIYEYYQTNFGSVPLLVMTPIHRINDADLSVKPIPLSDYVDIIIQKCREHGIPYVDTFAMSGLQPNNEGNSAIFFPRDDNSSHTIDGTHPNHLAHQRLARCIGETLNQMMLWNETAIR